MCQLVHVPYDRYLFIHSISDPPVPILPPPPFVIDGPPLQVEEPQIVGRRRRGKAYHEDIFYKAEHIIKRPVGTF